MDPATIAIILIILGLILLILEAVTFGSFVIVPGVVLIVMGALIYFVDGILDKWYLLIISAVIVTIAVTALTFKVYQLLAKPGPPTTTVVDSLIGREGVVTSDVQPGNLKGKVRIGSDNWSATSEEAISAGSEIVVYAAEGVHVKVRPK